MTGKYATRIFALVFLLLGAVTALGGECEDACMEEYVIAMEQCDADFGDAMDACMGEFGAAQAQCYGEYDACMAGCMGDPECEAMCYDILDTCLFNADEQFAACQHDAAADYEACQNAAGEAYSACLDLCDTPTLGASWGTIKTRY